MYSELKPWQLALIVLLFPPVGAYFVCSCPHIKLWIKILAVVYFVAVLLTVLSLRLPVGTVHINAERLN